LETLALVRALKQFHHYLAFRPFVVVTDCRALAYWNTVKREIPPDIARHLDDIQSYKATFIHRPGIVLVVPDALSRDERYDEMEEHAQKGFNPEEMKGVRNYKMMSTKSIRAMPIRLTGEETTASAAGIPSLLMKEQLKDKFCKNMRDFLQGKKIHDKEEERTKKEAKYFCVNGDMVYRWVKRGDFAVPVPYVPASGDTRSRILKAMHDDPIAGHTGFKRTLARLSERFYWETMEKDVKKHVASCHCTLNKRTGKRRVSRLQPLKVGAPFEAIHLDFCGPFPEGVKGYKYILVIVDRFTKWVEIIPTRTNDMATAAEKFDKRILKRFGTPKRVLVDNAFRGEFETLCDNNGIKLDFSQAHQHNTNGLAERMNRTIEEMLRSVIGKDIKTWPVWIPSVQAAINSAKAAAHSHTPFMMVTGWQPVLPIERILNREAKSIPERVGDEAAEKTNEEERTRGPKGVTFHEVLEEVIPRNEEEERTWMERAAKRRKSNQEIAKEGILASQEKMVRRDMRKKGEESKFETGVWVSVNEPSPKSKLNAVKKGPYQVAGRCVKKPANYILRYMGIDGTDLSVHTDKITEWSNFDKGVYLANARVRFPDPKSANSKSKRAKVRLLTLGGVEKEEDLRLHQLIGKRIQVWWTQLNRWDAGAIVGQEALAFWVKYDEVRDDEGLPYFMEVLLSPKGPKWRIEPEGEPTAVEEMQVEKPDCGNGLSDAMVEAK
jgi:hypothetical protein